MPAIYHRGIPGFELGEFPTPFPARSWRRSSRNDLNPLFSPWPAGLAGPVARFPVGGRYAGDGVKIAGAPVAKITRGLTGRTAVSAPFRLPVVAKKTPFWTRFSPIGLN